MIYLSWAGSCPVETPYIKIGQMFSMIYFMYFLMTSQMLILWDNLMK